MFSTNCYIRNNNDNIISRLKELGYYICSCCVFEDSEYLWASNIDDEMNGVVHGIGYRNPWDIHSKEIELDHFVQTNKGIDCGDNEDLFIELASIENDKDKSVEKSVLHKFGMI